MARGCTTINVLVSTSVGAVGGNSLDGGHGDGVTIGLPAGESTYQSPPALVSA